MGLIGIGQDSHRFQEGKQLVLAGKTLDGPGLKANSDGDVIYHSLCNAIASAIGEGSISTYADEMCKNKITDSSEYLKYIFSKVKGDVQSASISIECKEPKLESHLNDFKKNISSILNTKNIGITLTSGEGLTDFGKGLGIQAISIVLIGD